MNTDDSVGTITVTIYDNVGNSASDTITMTEDGDAPSLSVTHNFNVNGWCIKDGTDFGSTNIDITSIQDTVSGLNVGYFSA